MKNLFALFILLLPAIALAQVNNSISTYPAYYITNTAYSNVGDSTSFSSESGPVMLMAHTLTIGSTKYNITSSNEVFRDKNGFFYQVLQLDGNGECWVQRSGNYRLMMISIGQKKYYIR